MKSQIGDNFGNSKLGDVVKKLSVQYYPQLNELRSNMVSQANLIKNMHIHDSIVEIPDLCSALSNEIHDYLKLRETTFIPYILTIIDKRDQGRSNSPYDGNYGLKHAEQLAVAHQSHLKVKSALKKVQTVFEPGNKPIYLDAHLILQSHLTLIESSLTDILLLEEAYVKPELLNPQKGNE